MNNTIILLSLFLSFFAFSVHASEETEVGIQEKLGGFIASDAMFADESGSLIGIKKLIEKPTIIAPVYFGCTHACPMLLNGLADAVAKLTRIEPGKDFDIIALSFDEQDTPAVAADKKTNYVKSSFPGESWKFLTGNPENINKVMDSVGFTVRRLGRHNFSHPAALVIVAPGGKIVRYLDGVSFLPFELTMAINEASEGKIGSPSRRALMYCFSYDSDKKNYVFNVLKVTGTVMVLFVGSFLAYLLFGKGGKRSKE